MPRPANKAKLRYALRLRCCRCGVTPLQEEGKFFTFRQGCPVCDYAYDRGEEGYFQGAAWMVNYTLLAVIMLISAALILGLSSLSAIQTVIVLSIIAVVLGALIQPFGRSLWMWVDHILHPLGEDEHINKDHRR